MEPASCFPWFRGTPRHPFRDYAVAASGGAVIRDIRDDIEKSPQPHGPGGTVPVILDVQCVCTEPVFSGLSSCHNVQ